MQDKTVAPHYGENKEGLSVPSCRSTARLLISCSSMQICAAEEELLLCSGFRTQTCTKTLVHRKDALSRWFL